jgi:Rieske Fe-S protein
MSMTSPSSAHPPFNCPCHKCRFEPHHNLGLRALREGWRTHPDPDDLAPFPVRSAADLLDELIRDVRGEVGADD